MAKAVTLSSAAMSNLLSLQNTQSLVDRTQGRLSTGKAVNSALDDAMAFFKNRNLSNRAGDLADIKKDIQNGVNVIKEAVDSLEQVDSLLKSAKAAAQSARAEKDDKVRQNYIKQINDNLNQIVSLAADSNYDGINLIQAVENVNMAGGPGTAGEAAVTAVEADSARINQVRKEYAGIAFDRALQEKGAAFFGAGTATQIKFAANTDYGIANVDASDGAGIGAAESIADITGATANQVKKIGDDYYVMTNVTAGSMKGAKIDIAALKADFVAKSAEGTDSTLVTTADLKDNTKNAKGIGAYNEALQVAVNDEVAQNREAYQDLAGFVTPERLTVVFSEQDKTRKIDVQARGLGSVLSGLVNGMDAVTVKEADWVKGGKVQTQAIDDFINKIDKARNQVRAYAAELGNYSSIMSTRGEWTDNTVNTLKGGAADLVNANMNEESANMLALQTRQQLGVIALSIAQQSEQAVLRLF